MLCGPDPDSVVDLRTDTPHTHTHTEHERALLYWKKKKKSKEKNCLGSGKDKIFSEHFWLLREHEANSDHP